MLSPLLQFLDTATEIEKYDSPPRARSNVIEKHSEFFAVRVNVRGCSLRCGPWSEKFPFQFDPSLKEAVLCPHDSSARPLCC